MTPPHTVTRLLSFDAATTPASNWLCTGLHTRAALRDCAVLQGLVLPGTASGGTPAFACACVEPRGSGFKIRWLLLEPVACVLGNSLLIVGTHPEVMQRMPLLPRKSRAQSQHAFFN
mmetsp:Transcript_26547/g.35743  ORF Transcript_26547/g.35743 Transcript_26547/m.35743 type:complete len:117 (-) Transcript_26547:95-445(-)